MSEAQRNPIRRAIGWVVNLLPSGGDEDGPPPDIDGKRDEGPTYERAVLQAKSQMSPHGTGTTSWTDPKHRDDPES